jgi:hypothetical protein
MLYSPAPDDTVARWLKGTSLSAFISRSHTTVYDACRALDKKGWFNHSRPAPESEAIRFYLLNHAVSHIAQRRDLLEPLPADELSLLKAYATHGSEVAARLFWYMLLITTREARHNKSAAATKLASVTSQVKQTYPDISDALVKDIFNYSKSCSDTSEILHSHMLVERTKKFPLGPYVKTLSAIFHTCAWNGGYGGAPWGNIADALHSFVSGEWSAEMLADTAFTLAHNGGPMFNKEMLYYCYTGQFQQILDCQRAGMIPQWTVKFGGYDDHGLVADIKEVLPEIFEGKLDWHKVHALGAVGDYSDIAEKVPPQPPFGCKDLKIDVDHQTVVWALLKRAA